MRLLCVLICLLCVIAAVSNPALQIRLTICLSLVNIQCIARSHYVYCDEEKHSSTVTPTVLTSMYTAPSRSVASGLRQLIEITSITDGTKVHGRLTGMYWQTSQ